MSEVDPSACAATPGVSEYGVGHRPGRRCGWGVVLIVLLGMRSVAATSTGEALDFFERRIRPALVEFCYECHSAKAGDPKGGLRLDTREGLRRGGGSGQPAVVSHDVDQGTLLRAIRRTDADLAMPPKRVLAEGIVRDFEAWIRDGAVDPRTNTVDAGVASATERALSHWAFQPPVKPPVPAVEDRAWVRNPIDAFVRHRMDKAGLRPAPPADRRTLLRRLSYTLWGLPPEAPDVDAFERDPGADAADRRLEGLLASPRYGERWARHWLDVARYADTKGYVYYYEESRFVRPYAYRDWVIRALNEDLPYDRFLALQIAADQMVSVRDPGRGKSVATAATLQWPTPVYGADIAAMGFLTLGRRFLDLAPDIIDDRIDVLMRGTQALTVSCARCHDHKFDPIPTRDYYSLYGVFDGSEERLVAVEPEGDAGTGGRTGASSLDPEGTEAFARGTRERVETLERKFREAGEQVAERHRERVTEYLVAALDVARLPSDANVRPQPEDINPYQVRQWDRYLAQRGEAGDPLFAPWHAFRRLPPEQFAERAPAVARQLLEQPQTAVPAAVRSVVWPPPAAMREVAERYGGLLSRAQARWKQVCTQVPEGAVRPEHLPDPNDEALRQVLYDAESPVRVPAGSIVDLEVHLYFDDPNRVALAKLQMELEQWLMTNPAATPHVVALRDRPHQIAPVVFRRGDPLKRGEIVPRQFPAVLSGRSERRPFTQGSGRLDLARAITDPRNPLTSRVLVNRVWAQHFGEGLVRTPSDFGVRGEPPSHPELLDWLACWFEEQGRSLKALHRLILSSATYQQASTPASPTVFDLDPENQLLTRAARRRLDFESFRDALLVVCGELDERRGGPGEELFRAPFSRRRSIYGFVDRKSVPGLLRAFDVANPDMHAPRRHATTVPQQALALMNHPFVLERARALAKRLETMPDTDVDSLVAHLYRWTLQRAPSLSEREDARAFFASMSQEFPPTVGGNGAPAGESSPLARLRPWEELAQVLLLSNEFAFVD